VFYETGSGRSPVREFLDRLSPDEAAKVTVDLDLLAEFGVELGIPHVRPVRGKIWELRTVSRVQHRVLYVAVSGKRLVLLHAFTKKTPKTSLDDIALAERRFAAYRERFGE
jgi:phage-related protein